MLKGNIIKLGATLTAQNQAEYSLRFKQGVELPLNALLGQKITLTAIGSIHCDHCNREIKKTFGEGYCFPCFQKLAAADICIVKPELCHYDKGTCREPQWGEEHCLRPHCVYLANTAELKVGITRQKNIPTRWIDQGAVAALPLLMVQTRLQAGFLEVKIKQYISDKTNWRKMLQGEIPPLDLLALKQQILAQIEEDLEEFVQAFGEEAIQMCEDASVQTIDYPVLQYPRKISSLSLEKNSILANTLLGIKGQYLILEGGVLNVRKFTGYEVEFSV